MKKQANINSDIPVVIFCGGTGSRLREETLFKPKPMVEVGERPILWHIMKMYQRYGFNNFILTLGYKGEYIRDYFKSRKGRDFFGSFNTILAETGESTPHGERLLKVRNHINTDNIFCTYGDGVSDVDLREVLNYHLSRGPKVVATLTGVHLNHHFGILQVDRSGLATGYKKGHPMKETVLGGFMIFNKKFFDFLKEGMMIEDPFDMLAKKGKLAVYDHRGYFGAVDTYRDLEILNETWRKDAPWKVWSD